MTHAMPAAYPMPRAPDLRILRGMKLRLPLVALALVLLVACTGLPGPSANSPTLPPASDPSATTDAEPSERPTQSAPPAVAWAPASVPASEMNSAMTSVVPGGDGLVAVGFDGAFGSIVWTSTDGSAWRDVTPDGFQSYGLVSTIELADSTLLAVGRGDTINVEAESAAGFRSEDGLIWFQVDGGANMRGQILDVVEDGGGILIAVGGVPGGDSAGFWRSTDAGETWQRSGADIPQAFLWAVTEGGPGFVAVGWRRTPTPSAAVWTSTDGVTWEAAADPEGFSGFEGIDVVAAPNGTLVMAGGLVAGGEGRIWTSTNGVDWSIAEVEGGLMKAGIRSLVVTPIGLVGVGHRNMDGAAWLSTDDGASWAPLGEPLPDAYFTNAFPADDGLIIVGGTQTGTLETGIDGRAAVWLTTLGD